MANSTYMNNRRKYSRPQAMLWSENAGSLDAGLYAPLGYEVGQDPESISDFNNGEFLILSDDNRQPISFRNQRIETRERMINGRMRSYHVADKLEISTSWSLLPSRSFMASPSFSSSGAPSQDVKTNSVGLSGQYTTDGGAGGVDILSWYENHKGSFWVFLAYDKYSNFESENDKYNKLGQYNEVVEMFIADFQYSVEKRNGSSYDFWNVSVTLEEV
jgi:hypothetical protein